MSNSSSYVPPHLRGQATESNHPQQPRPNQQIQFNQNNNYRPPNYRNNQNVNLFRSRSMPGQLRAVSDALVEQKFAENEETSDMSVYDDAEVTVHSNQTVDPIDKFPGCGIRNEILLSVASIGFKSPTSVQKYAIPYILAQHDVLVTSQTGSGKTAAYMLPVISINIDYLIIN